MNGSITRKNGLCQNIKNLYYKGIDPNNFFPRCYDLSINIERDDFFEDFKLTKAISVLVKFNEIKDYKPKLDVLKTALNIVERKLPILLMQFENWNIKNQSLRQINDEEWSTLESEDNPITRNQPTRGKNIQSISVKNLNSQVKFPLLKSMNIKNNLMNAKVEKRENSKNPGTNIKEEEKKGDTEPLDKKLDAYREKVGEVVKKLSEKLPQFKLNGYRNIWIIKPGNLSRGRGIMVLNKLNQIIQQYNASNSIIVQKYIENPLIILSRKFDIRQWVLVTSINPLTIWLWEKPYLRFGAENYNIDKIDNIYSHLTNNSIAKHSENFKNTPIEGNMWEIEKFESFLKNLKGKECWTEIQNKFIRAIISSFDSARHQMKQRKNSHELFGYDFMIDEDLNVFLIEVNASPALDYSTKITEKLVKMMLNDYVELVIDNQTNMDRIDRVHNWRKIYQGQGVDKSYLPNIE
ncbi:MAG: tubulin--tyrosine ligase family protein [archaeon]|nr:tubulin--tyrosine ligase family protein [archaeon]